MKDEPKGKIAMKLLSLDHRVCTKRKGSSFGKPIFLKIPEKSVDSLDLSLFVSEDLWSIFSIMKLNYGSLSKPVEYCPKDADYLEAKLIINNLSVVNDGAERGVKLAYDYIGSSKKEDNFQNILQTVENDSRLLPNQREIKLTPKGWSLKQD